MPPKIVTCVPTPTGGVVTLAGPTFNVSAIPEMFNVSPPDILAVTVSDAVWASSVFVYFTYSVAGSFGVTVLSAVTTSRTSASIVD